MDRRLVVPTAERKIERETTQGTQHELPSMTRFRIFPCFPVHGLSFATERQERPSYLLHLAGHHGGIGLGDGISTSGLVIKCAVVLLRVAMYRAEDVSTSAFEAG